MAIGVWLHMTESHAHKHVHERMAHTHPHVHDEHHRHGHSAIDPPGEPHTHLHEHNPLEHAHPHVPDTHHAHRHDWWRPGLQYTPCCVACAMPTGRADSGADRVRRAINRSIAEQLESKACAKLHNEYEQCDEACQTSECNQHGSAGRAARDDVVINIATVHG
jgi:hypothetical protein